LKHAGYSATTILPGESAIEFEKLHRQLISEWAPNGPLEENTIANMAHLLWRRKNLSTFRTADLARQRIKQLRSAMVVVDPVKSDEVGVSDESDRAVIERWQASETQARHELGELYALVEMGEEATLDRLRAIAESW
jgi:hypothetical protein